MCIRDSNSQTETLAEFRKHFYLHGVNRSTEESLIRDAVRRCLSCIKTRTGKSIPRPLWYMVYATAPFEYIHLDFMELPDATNGMKYVLVVVCDFSLTTLLHPCHKADTETVVKALLEHWLSHYPDPLLLHTDGGSHFDNAVVRAIAKIKGCLLYTSPSPRD